VFLRGRIYWIAYCCRLDGKVREVRESADTEREAEAWECLADRVRQARTPEVDFDPRAERLTFDDLAEGLLRDYRVNRRRSLEHADRAVRRLRDTFGGMRAVDIDTDRIQAYTDARLENGAAPASVNRELAALKRMYSLAVQTRKGFRFRPYIPMLAEENAREGFLEPADFESLCSALPCDLADVARFAYLTGWRKGEVLGLEWRDVDMRVRVIRLRAEHSKNKRPRVVKLAGELLTVLERRAGLRQLDCTRVFHIGGRPVRSFRKTWASACKTAGLAGMLFHDLRRSAVRNMVRAGVPELVAMRVSGHRTRAVFDRYDITSEADLEAAAEATSRYVAERREVGPSVVPIASNSDKLSDNSRVEAS
jgi:integrase